MFLFLFTYICTSLDIPLINIFPWIYISFASKISRSIWVNILLFKSRSMLLDGWYVLLSLWYYLVWTQIIRTILKDLCKNCGGMYECLRGLLIVSLGFTSIRRTRLVDSSIDNSRSILEANYVKFEDIFICPHIVLTSIISLYGNFIKNNSVIL